MCAVVYILKPPHILGNGGKMTEKEKYIRQAFARYRKNKKQIAEMRFEQSNSASPPATKSRKNSNGYENALIGYIDKKLKLEKACEIVERTLYHYEVYERANGDGKAQYIRCRFLQGMSFALAGVECELAESTACFWLEDIRTTATAIAETYNLWGT